MRGALPLYFFPYFCYVIGNRMIDNLHERYLTKDMKMMHCTVLLLVKLVVVENLQEKLDVVEQMATEGKV